MAFKKIEPRDFYKILVDDGINVELISGKWLVNKKEYSLYGKGGLLDRLTDAYEWMASNANTEAFVKFMIDKKSTEDEEWPPLPILVEAKEKLATGYRPSSIAFPLNKKELMILHYLVDGDAKDTYAIFFHGVGGSGKSTICNLFASIFGNLDVSRCGFTDLGNQFSRETIAGKRLWYDADISPHWSEHASNILKKVITNDTDQFQKKGKNPYQAQYRCKCLFCCNVPPKFDITDSGTLRRIIYYSKNKKIDKPDGSLVNKKYTHDELVDIVCEALLTDISEFYEEFRQETQEIIMSGNNVARYGMDCNYQEYISKCYAGNIHPFGVDKWEALKELFTQWKSEQTALTMTNG